MLGSHVGLEPVLINEYSEQFELLIVQVKAGDKDILVITGYGPQEHWSDGDRLPFFTALEEEIASAEYEGKDPGYHSYKHVPVLRPAICRPCHPGGRTWTRHGRGRATGRGRRGRCHQGVPDQDDQTHARLGHQDGQFFTSLCKMVAIHLKDVNTLHSCNVI